MKLKKVTALLLATSMVLSSVSVASFADDEIIFEPEVGVTATANEDEAYFGEEEGDVVDEQTATDDEAFFSDEVIDETVTDDVITEDENIADTANEVVDYAFEENADIYAAIENAEDTVSDEVSYDITGDMSYKGKYDGKAHGLDVSKSGKAEGEVRFKHPELGEDVYTLDSPTATHVTGETTDGVTAGTQVDYETKEYTSATATEKTWTPGSATQTITIEPAPVTVAFNTSSFTEGAALPTLTVNDFTFTGLVNGEETAKRFKIGTAYTNLFDNFEIQKWNGAQWETVENTTIYTGGKFKAGSNGKYSIKGLKEAYAQNLDDIFEEIKVSGQDYNDYAKTFIGGEFTITEAAKTNITVYWPDDLTFVYAVDGDKQTYEPSLTGYKFEPTDGTTNEAYNVGTYTYTIGKVSRNIGSAENPVWTDVTSSVTVTNPTHEWKIKKAKAYAFVTTGLPSFEYGVKDPLATMNANNVTFYEEKTRDTAIADPSVATGTAEFQTTYSQYDPVNDYSGTNEAPAYYYVRYKSGLESKNYEILLAEDDTENHTNAFTLTPAQVKVTPDNITVAFGDPYVEPTYKLEDVNKDSGSAAVLQHDIDAGAVILEVFTSTAANSVAGKVTPKDVGDYYYTATLEDAVKGNHATRNFSTVTGEDKEKLPCDTTRKYAVNSGEFTVKVSDYEGVYDGKPHSIIVEPDPLPSNVAIYYSATTPLTTELEAKENGVTTPITFVDAKDTPALVYWFVLSDGLGSGLSGSNKVTIKDADKTAAEAVEKQIEEATTKDAEGKYDPAKVKAAREAYDALTNDQKAMVDQYDVKALKDAEAAIAASAEADAKEVEDKIAALPDPENVTEADADAIMAAKDAYDNLSDDAKAKVSKDAKDKLDADIAALEGQEEADKKAAKAVEDEIDALPEASEAKASDKEAADKAVEDYNALTDAQKALVPADKVEKMNAVKAAADAAAEEDEKAEKERELFDEAVALVKAQKNGVDGKAAAENAKKAYDNLSDAAKAKLTDEEIKAYEDAQKAYTKDYTFNSGEGVFRVLSNGEVTYLKPLHPENTWFVVPNMVKKNGFMYKVVKVSTKAFMGCTKATKIKIGKNVQSIGAYAFKNTPAMTKLIMLTSKLASGKVTNSFGGAGKEKGAKLTNEVPNGKSSAYESLFKGEGGMNAGAKFTENN